MLNSIEDRSMFILGYLEDSNAAAHSVDTGISYRENSWERCLENDQVVINSGFPTVNCRK